MNDEHVSGTVLFLFNFHVIFFSFGMLQNIYDEILNNQADEQSKISLRAIENMTKIYANFAKYG